MQKTLRELREAAGLTMRELAARAGIHESTYNLIEHGKRGLSVKNAKAVSKVLRCDWTIFFPDDKAS